MTPARWRRERTRACAPRRRAAGWDDGLHLRFEPHLHRDTHACGGADTDRDADRGSHRERAIVTDAIS
jgi:hypothetical protein